MELNEMEKKMLFQAEGDCQAKVLNELYMTVRYSNNSELREAAESLMAKVRVLSDRECMDLVRDIQKNYRLPHPPRTIGETGSVYAADVEDLRTRLDDLWNGMDKLLRGFANIS